MLIFLWLALVIAALAFRNKNSAWISLLLCFFVLSLMGDNRGNFVGYVLPVALLAGVIAAMY
jgi:hypothetical protein